MGRKRIMTEIKFETMDKRIEETFQNLRAYEYGDCRIITGRNETMGFYMNVSGKKRWPTFEEITDIVARLTVGNIDMAVLIPKKTEPGKFMLHVHQVAIPEFKDVIDAQGKTLGKEEWSEQTPEAPRD